MASRPKLNRVWASKNDSLRRDPGDAKYITGWVAEIPTYQVLNFLQYKNDVTLLALAERGVFEWGSDVQYSTGSLAWDEATKKVYICQVASPPPTPPSSSGNNWAVSSIQITRNEYDSAKAAWVKHIQDTTSNPHKLTPGMLNAYTKEEVDAILSDYRTRVSQHASRTDNPHQLTAAKVGAVPVTGGTYTGDVTFETRQIFLQADGGHKIKVESGIGLFLESGAAVLGIDLVGGGSRPMAGSSLENRSEIITEATFDANKLQVENLYAVPQPDFYMPLVGSPNVHIGDVTVDGPYNPQYNAAKKFVMVPAIGSNMNLLYSENPMEGLVEFSMAIDAEYLAPTGTDVGIDSVRFAIGFGTFPDRVTFAFYGGPNRRMAVLSDNLTLGSYTMPSQTPHRFVVTRTADRIRVYADGVQLWTSPYAGKPMVGTGYGLNMLSTTAAAANEPGLAVTNLRAWRSALTAEQVSRL